MIVNILKYGEFAAAIILFFFAAIQLIYRNKQFINFNIAGLYFFTAHEILTFWLFKTELIYSIPVLTYTDITSTFALGPFVYFYYKTIVGMDIKFNVRYFMHFLPALISLFIIVASNIIHVPAVIELHAVTKGFPLFWISPLMWWLNNISLLHMTGYFVITLKAGFELLNKGKHKSMKEFKIAFLFLAMITGFGALMLIGSIIKNIILAMIAVYSIIITAIGYFLFSFRFPEFTQKAIRESRSIQYENSMLNGIDHQVVLDRLDYLMAEEKAYTDCELTLQKLSKMLMVTGHQLSEILNTKRTMNFRSLVNSYRVKEVMKQMTEYPEKTILEIAFDCGFNSKSSFNSVFFTSTGITPSDYKKRTSRAVYRVKKSLTA